MNCPAGESQVIAWKDSISVLKNELGKAISSNAQISTWTMIFEYELPRERGRRPDLILLADNRILVFEFKEFSEILKSHVDQVAAYSRDLKNYQAASHDNPIYTFLILTLAKNLQEADDQVQIISADNLENAIKNLPDSEQYSKIDVQKWIAADYDPLPSLISAARLIFKNEPLPSIHRALSAGIPQTIRRLIEIADEVRQKKEHHLALVTGVPGSGKTLVGLQFVYHDHFHNHDNGRSAVFLSGNGPLVQVLQDALKSSVFVQDVHGFLKQYGGTSARIPGESIFIFDEAQRAWDIDRVKEKRGNALSEPQDFLGIGAKKDWSMMIGLIGEGQEIHIGEEAGLGQWNQAIKTSKKPWIVNCPTKVSSIFTAASRVIENDELNLTLTLRSHLAADLQFWVETLLKGELEQSYEWAQKVKSQGFNLYLTSDLGLAFDYVKERYKTDESKRFGIIASSKARNLPSYGIRNEFQMTQHLRVGPWYNEPPSSNNSCCQLREVATEFSCQGLELDFPIIGWGNDLKWENSKWVSPVPGVRSQAHDPHLLRLNSYRVLLTRGRDGMIVFIPSNLEMEQTYKSLLESGMEIL